MRGGGCVKTFFKNVFQKMELLTNNKQATAHPVSLQKCHTCVTFACLQHLLYFAQQLQSVPEVFTFAHEIIPLSAFCFPDTQPLPFTAAMVTRGLI